MPDSAANKDTAARVAEDLRAGLAGEKLPKRLFEEWRLVCLNPLGFYDGLAGVLIEDRLSVHGVLESDDQEDRRFEIEDAATKQQPKSATQTEHQSAPTEQLSVIEQIKQPLVFVAALFLVNALLTFLVEVGHPAKAAVDAGLMLLEGVGGSFIWAGVTMLLARLLGSEKGFGDTYAACAYAAAPNVLLWLPFINIFTGLYSLFLLKIALEKVHGLSPSRANAVIGIEIGVWILIGMLMFFAAMNTLLKSGGSQI